MKKPILGMKFVTKASTPQTKAAGTPRAQSSPVSMTATIRPKAADTQR